jgi:hypothetical protein
MERKVRVSEIGSLLGDPARAAMLTAQVLERGQAGVEGHHGGK